MGVLNLLDQTSLLGFGTSFIWKKHGGVGLESVHHNSATITPKSLKSVVKKESSWVCLGLLSLLFWE